MITVWCISQMRRACVRCSVVLLMRRACGVVAAAACGFSAVVCVEYSAAAEAFVWCSRHCCVRRCCCDCLMSLINRWH
ncbi:hypothetical protein HanPI659440_Chr14g0546121 [Helianthus annuus]|nr:hypothetical protein HanPI659440_Chr14g0546121 [Helianthus annuus]